MLKFIKQKWFQVSHFLGTIFITLYCHSALADMPPAPDNANIDKGDIGAGIFDLFKEHVGFAVPMLLGLGFLLVLWAAITEFMRAKHTKEWGHFIAVVVIGGVLLVILLILGNFAIKYFGGSPSA